MGNHNSGRRPQPTSLKLLRGNPGKRKVSKREPKPPEGDVVMPSGLSAGAVEMWQELAPIALAMRTLTPADVRVFGTLCELQATLLAASAAKSDPAPEIQGGAIKLERDTAVAVRPYYALFGLEPVSRARMVTPQEPEKPKSKWAGVLA
jgi:phage terminase small subunit